jgi:signal transduction histidine kinase
MTTGLAREQRSVPDSRELFDVFVGMLHEVDVRDPSSPGAFYDRVCEAVCRLTSMERAVLFLNDPADERAEVAGVHGISRDALSALDATLDDAPMARRALAEDEVVEVSEGIDAQVNVEYARLFGVTTLTCIPLAAGHRWFGVVFADRGGGRFALRDEERHAMWTLGKTAALAASTRLVTRVQERGRRLAERVELARDIHDRVMQRLFGVSLALGADGLSPEAQKRCREELHEALGDLRSALRRTPGEDPPGSLRGELERLAGRPRHPVSFDWQEGLRVPSDLDPLARAVLNEALRNAAKHARPERIEVAVARRDGALVMEVVNDGVGPHPRVPRTRSGMGLRLAAFEAVAYGGSVEYGPRPPDRWQVRLTVPFEASP